MNGSDLVSLAKGHVGERYVFGVLVPKNDANWHGPWDCAEFVSWCVFQTAGQLYGCLNDKGNPANADAYTGYWSRDVDSLGIKISVEHARVTPGAAVLRLPAKDATGHIVLSDGSGATVEAHSTATGVIQSKLDGRRWDCGILIPGIQYNTM